METTDMPDNNHTHNDVVKEAPKVQGRTPGGYENLKARSRRASKLKNLIIAEVKSISPTVYHKALQAAEKTLDAED